MHSDQIDSTQISSHSFKYFNMQKFQLNQKFFRIVLILHQN